ncbi:hypothetical protein L1887_09260 [Cichorium endivia]|nr:hypothetical protein L1887_09260 [Cichorium endivia]
MHLYNLTLQKATGIVCAINGSFSGGNKSQEIVVARGKVLELLRPDENGKIQNFLSVDVFGAIRSLAQFRLTGAQKDYIVVGSDSGRIVILEYNREKNVFDKIHKETFGKSGSRRIVPGQYLAIDPKGRAVMIGACEKQKLVYVLNRDTAARLSISSPLEAHKSQTITYSIAGVDCGFDNPIFAAIELDYSESDQAANKAQKHLTFYELDLGLNHVSRKWFEQVDNGANMLVTVPGGGDGPCGVLVCAENFVIYKNQGHPDVRAVIPRRADLPADRGVLIVSATMHKQKSMFFFLLQTEYGDVFKVTLDHDNEHVTELKIKYFDTIPVTSSMCLIKLGFLFAASEFGNHALYQFQAIGADPDVESSSATLMETEEGFQPVFFKPRGLKNLVRIDQVESLMPIMSMKVVNLFEEEAPQIFTLCGRGPRSSLRILRPGLSITEMATSQLPGVPSAIWTVKKNVNDQFDAYIVVSFANATVVLSIGDTVEEVSDRGFLNTAPSLAVSLIGDDSLMQVHPNDPDDCMQVLSVQSVSSPPDSLLFLEVQASVGCEDGTDQLSSLFLNAGLQSGVLFRTVVDMVTGQLSDARSRFLGLKAPKLFSVLVRGRREGIVAVAGDALRVFTIDKLGETFNETAIPLRGVSGGITRTCKKECFEAAGEGQNGKMEIENGNDDEDKDDPLSDEQYGYPKAEDDEAAFSICTVNFHDKEYGTLLAVGTAKGLQIWPERSLVAGYIHIYRFVKDGRSLELLHKTQVDGVPLALCQFQGKLLAGIGSILRLYDLGKRKLLRKCENKSFPNTINSIHTYRDRIYVGDIQESFHYCKSAYFPVKDVIDGDLCEQFPTLPLDIQRKIADELDRTPGEILKKLEEIRNKIV